MRNSVEKEGSFQPVCVCRKAFQVSSFLFPIINSKTVYLLAAAISSTGQHVQQRNHLYIADRIVHFYNQFRKQYVFAITLLRGYSMTTAQDKYLNETLVCTCSPEHAAALSGRVIHTTGKKKKKEITQLPTVSDLVYVPFQICWSLSVYQALAVCLLESPGYCFSHPASSRYQLFQSLLG